MGKFIIRLGGSLGTQRGATSNGRLYHEDKSPAEQHTRQQEASFV